VTALDHTSQLADVEGGELVTDVEAELERHGFTLGLERPPPAMTVDAWLASGAPGARDAWLDPADHLVAGLDARLHDGRNLHVAPSPRRAVGPDLVALVVGARGRFARVTRAWLRVHARGASRPTTSPFAHGPDAPVSPGEARLLDAIETALRNPPKGRA
jgi:alkyldihydroxyacetonephosphate synthase